MTTATTSPADSPAERLGRALASIPAVDIALLAGGRVADLGCGDGEMTIAIARAYPEALVDGFEIDGPSIDAARTRACLARVTGRVAFRRADVNLLRPAHLPAYAVVVAPAHLREAAARLAGERGHVIVRGAEGTWAA